MAKQRKGRAKHPRTPNRPRIERRQVERASPPFDAESQPLIQTLKRALYADHPLGLLDAVSGLVAVTQPRPSLARADEPVVELEALVQTFEEADFAPTTAALHVIAALTADELLAARIRRVVERRHQRLPAWLTHLRDTRVVDVVELSHILRDGENYFLDVRLPDGYALCAVIYVDNNLGRIVKDAFVIPERFETVRQQMASNLDSDTTLGEVDPSAARALLERAVQIGAITFPPLESDTWPLCRPLVEWLIGLLPPGAVEPEWREWTQQETDELIGTFLASVHGAGYDDEDHSGLLRNLLWFGTSYATGDPLRWSPVNVEIVLADWFPRKIVADVAYLTKLPPLLAGFVRFAHEQLGIGGHLTDQTLDAISRWTPEYQRLIRSDRPQGPEALLRMLTDPGQGGSDLLASTVGGEDRLATLNDDPLPDEEFDWSGLPDDVRPRLAEILALCDASAIETLDLEHRTANRRLLRQLALADPAYFRGRAAARTSAAAVCWMVAQANDSVGGHGAPTTAALLALFGVRSASARAKQFRKILGLAEQSPYDGPMDLGAPEFLVSARRAEIVEERDFSW